jgi:hypothetical protein
MVSSSSLQLAKKKVGQVKGSCRVVLSVCNNVTAIGIEKKMNGRSSMLSFAAPVPFLKYQSLHRSH